MFSWKSDVKAIINFTISSVQIDVPISKHKIKSKIFIYYNIDVHDTNFIHCHVSLQTFGIKIDSIIRHHKESLSISQVIFLFE